LYCLVKYSRPFGARNPEPAHDQNRRAGPHPAARQIAPDHEAEHGRPEQRRVLERRDDRRATQWLRRAAESRDADLVVQAALQYAAASQDVSILDRIDGDEYLKIKKEASRAPQRLLRTDEEVEEMRAARSKAQQSQQGMAAMQGMAKAAKDAVPALQQARDSGMLQQLSAMQPQVQP